MTSSNSIRRGSVVLGLATTILLTGCAAGSAPAATPAETGAEAVKTPTAPAVLTVAGHDVGQFPPVPLFQLPDLALLDSSASAFTIDMNEKLASIPGVTASPAHCDAGGSVISGQNSAVLYGDGSGAFTGPDGTVQNFGDGSGTTTINGVTVQNFGDGSGTFSDGATTIQNFGDGSGTYADATKTVQIFGDGSGNYTDGSTTIQNFGDGSGTFTDGTVTIQNFGDGSGHYTDGTLTIQNDGDGTARIDGTAVDAEPLAPVAKLGSFPPLAALAPLDTCGTTLTFDDGVLFDFDRSEIRADAAATLDRVAEVFGTLGVAQADVTGHTDAIGSDDYNQALSEKRARSVVTGLTDRDVTATLSAEGLGESRPVAPNELNGADNPAGRQLNRRVEIFIPAVL